MELEIIAPRPLSPTPRPIPAKGQHEQDGPTESDVLLESIVTLARKPLMVTTKSALRTLIVRFSREHALDF
jgi:hypothetical protein